MKEYCVLEKNSDFKKLQSLIKLYYDCNNQGSLQELNLQHILNNVSSKEARNEIKNIWYDLDSKLGYELYVLYNLAKTENLRKGFHFILKIQPEVGREIAKAIYESTGMQLKVLDVKVL